MSPMDDERLSGKYIRIIARPNSSRTEIKGWDEDRQAFRVNVKAPADKGKANAELVRYFSKRLKKKVSIKSGLTSKEKVLKTC